MNPESAFINAPTGESTSRAFKSSDEIFVYPVSVVTLISAFAPYF
jgi:hypothetical protein